MKRHLIAPSVLAANFAQLGADIEMVNQSNADWFHIDVMDGLFVPNISFGFPVIDAVAKIAQKPLDIHLMIVDPDRYIERFAAYKPVVISVHIEACNHLHRSIQNIHQYGVKAGVAINPHTSVSLLNDVAEDLDLVCLMSVNPGFGGQKFIENTYRKINELVELREKRNASFLIEIDGGVTLNNAEKLLVTGADVLVAGNTVFSAENPKKTISELKSINTYTKL